MLLPASGCTSTSTNNVAPTALTEGPKDTGSYPNLNIPPQVAAKQFTKEETAASLSQAQGRAAGAECQGRQRQGADEFRGAEDACQDAWRRHAEADRGQMRPDPRP
ncbi:hypothetical protein ACVOMV_13370 [Mesorhizobium atlanticum]